MRAAELLRVKPWQERMAALNVRANSIGEACDRALTEDSSAKARIDHTLQRAASTLEVSASHTATLLRGRVVTVFPDSQLHTSPSSEGLQQVLDKLHPSDVVLLRPGTYHGPFRSTVANITLRGFGKAVLLNSQPVPAITLKESATMEGIDIRQRGLEGSAVMVEAACSVVVRQCEIHSANRAAIEVEMGTLSLEDCNVRSERGSGVAIGKGSALGGHTTIRGGSVTGCGAHGVELSRGTLSMQGVSVSKNARCGVLVEDSDVVGPQHTIEGTSFLDNGECGLFVGRNQRVDSLVGSRITGTVRYFVDPRSSVPLGQLETDV